MSFKFTLGLLVLAVVAVVGFGLAQRQSPPPANGPTVTPTPVLTDFEAGTVTSIDIKTGGKETSLTKNGASWQLVKPVQTPDVDQTKVDRIVGQLAQLGGTTSVAKAGEDITPFGLRTPQVTVQLSGSNKTETLLIGDKNVNGSEYYATRQEGSDVALIPSSLVNSITDLVSNPPEATPTPVPSSPPASAVAASAAPSG